MKRPASNVEARCTSAPRAREQSSVKDQPKACKKLRAAGSWDWDHETCLPTPKKTPILSPRLEGAAPSGRWALTREQEQVPVETQSRHSSQSSPRRRHTSSCTAICPGPPRAEGKPLGGLLKKQAAKTQGAWEASAWTRSR